MCPCVTRYQATFVFTLFNKTTQSPNIPVTHLSVSYIVEMFNLYASKDASAGPLRGNNTFYGLQAAQMLNRSKLSADK